MNTPLSDTYVNAVGIPNNSASGPDFWDKVSEWWNTSVLHPFQTLKGATRASSDGQDTSGWSNYDYINYGNTRIAPTTPGGNESAQYSSSSPDASLDQTGYDQAQWEYDKQLELLAEQRAFNSAEAQKNREWQERMSNTAYQRAVQDLEAAGLNKWLAVTGGANGASASTPSGSSATSSSGDVSAPNPYLAKAMIQFGQGILSAILKALR